MSLRLPRGKDAIPIAVADVARLRFFGQLFEIDGINRDQAVAFKSNSDPDDRCVWVRTTYKSYRKAWNAAAAHGLVDPLSDFGPAFDVDHLYPRCWAEKLELEAWWLRLYPVFAEVNRSAGAGREKSAKQQGEISRPRGKIIFADELQILKLIGHPIGTAADPETMFR